MEVVAFGALLNTMLPKLWEHIRTVRLKHLAIASLIEDIKKEVPMAHADLEKCYSLDNISDRDKMRLMDLDRGLKVLCQDIHECIHRFMKSSTTEANCTKFGMKIEGYMKKLLELQTDLKSSLTSFKEATDSYQPSGMYVGDGDVVGMVEPLAELLELVKPPHEQLGGTAPELVKPHEEQLGGTAPKVISIVGFCGLGKTVLARQVYDSEVGQAFDLRAWVTAAGNRVEEVLKDMLKEVDPGGKHGESTLDFRRLCDCLRKYLRGKRYLIVIDEMRKPEQWNLIKNLFRDVNSIIIVTTTIQTVANACSNCNNGDVYTLSPLDGKKSLDLFSKECPMKDPRLAVDLLKKCDGLPLAIVGVAHIVHYGLGSPSDACEAACRQLGTYLLKEECSLRKLQSVLMNKYIGLRGYATRSCLLYFCLYKQNMADVPRRNSLLRRWHAEGFVDAETGCEIFNTLIDHNIIQPMEISKNGAKRRCRPPGVMIEYISQISMSENFAALVSDAVKMPTSRIRRLSFQPGIAADDRSISSMDLSVVLTLAVSGDGCEAILNFEKYELLAVLDLKECTTLNDKHVKYICKLLKLKYLSLGDTIWKIPREIGDLILLETLEMKTTDRVKVYREVFKLPKLKHLHGKFKLKDNPDKDLEDFLSTKSDLETITGFISKTAIGFPRLLCHMRRLRKVKIIFTAEASDADMKALPTAIKEFTREGTDVMTYNRSLSIDFAEFAETERMPSPLEFLEDPGSLTSLKLRGDWRPFLRSKRRAIPDFTQISGITKLCLSRTYLSGNYVLASLTSLIALEYLKLGEEVLGRLEIEPGTFQNLTRLCLVGETRLYGISILPEALPSLVSLHLICKALEPGLESSIGIGSVKYLKEIALDSEVDTNIKDAWKTAAKGHPNRPHVLLIQKGAPIRQA